MILPSHISDNLVCEGCRPFCSIVQFLDIQFDTEQQYCKLYQLYVEVNVSVYLNAYIQNTFSALYDVVHVTQYYR